MSAIPETGAVALLFAVAFLVGGRVHPLRVLVRDPRSLVSFGSGIAVAYVFLRVMPDLQAARSALVESASTPLRYEGMAVYLLALIGFLVFYGLDHLRAQLRRSEEAGEAAAFRLDISGFAAYVWLMAYLLVHNLEETPVSIGLYAIAITSHFLAMDHSLRGEYGAAYKRIGRFVLAGMCVLGWIMGQLFTLPTPVLALLVAFISGGIIVNSTIMELPSEKDGRFLPFLFGGVLYALILLPLA